MKNEGEDKRDKDKDKDEDKEIWYDMIWYDMLCCLGTLNDMLGQIREEDLLS